MDIFYRNQINAGVLHFVSIPRLVGIATLRFNVPAPQGQTFVRGALVTQLNYGQRTNTQFQQSLDNTIYVYSFGDLMGDLTLSGLVFPRSCDGSGNGIDQMQKYYSKNRVSKKVETMQVTFASHVIKGYLVGLNMATVDVSSGMHNFNLLLKTIPASFRRAAATGGSAQLDANDQESGSNEESGEVVAGVGEGGFIGYTIKPFPPGITD